MERDDFVSEQEQAAAAEAARIGGDPGRNPEDADPDRFDGRRGEAFRAVEEAGGGESEGFEDAEALLEMRATDTHQPSPMVDRERQVEERASVEGAGAYAEADHVRHEDA